MPRGHHDRSGVRYARGNALPHAKLTPDKVRAIRRLGGKIKDEAIAAQFGISPGNVGHIRKRRTWKHL